MRHLLLLFFLVSSYCFSQNSNPIEAAKLALSQAKNANDSIKAYQDLAWFSQTSSIKKSFEYNKLAQKIIDRIGDKDASNTNVKELAGYVYRSGDYEKAAQLYNEAKNEYKKLKDELNVAKINSNLGAVYQTWSKPKLAMQEYIAALHFFEKSDEYLPYTATTLGNIAVLHRSLGNKKEALSYFHRAEKIINQQNDPISQANIKMNIGSLLIDLNRKSEAKAYLLSSREIAKNTNNNTALAAASQNLGTLELEKNNLKEAELYFKEALAIKQELGDMNEAATSQLSLGILQMKLGQSTEAIENLKMAVSIFEKNDNEERLLDAYPALNKAYTLAGQKENAIALLDKYTLLEEKIAQDNITKITLELDKKYQSEKKEKLLAQNRTKLLEKEAQLRKKKFQLLVLAIFLLSALLISIFIYRNQKFKNQQLKQENELKEAKAKIEIQNKLQAQRLHISRDLHDNIGSQLTFLISSMDNLKYADNLTNEFVNNKLDNLSSFTRSTIGELRDTIWAMNHEKISIENLEERIIGHLTNATNTGVSMEFDLILEDNIDPTYAFDAVSGMHLFRIIQESINNAVKYSKSQKIDIRFNKKGNNLYVEIQDYGIGFDLENANSGNGLKNIRHRISEMHGEVKIESTPEIGTKISIVIPLN
jgi:signal transduction histidine kinase